MLDKKFVQRGLAVVFYILLLVATLGLAFTGLGMVGYAGAWEGWMIYVVIVATALESLAEPPLRSIASVHVPPTAQGELHGALTSISSMTTILGLFCSRRYLHTSRALRPHTRFQERPMGWPRA